MQRIPRTWLPDAPMQRIIFHWTGGSYKAGKRDRAHYHFLREGSGNLVRGVKIGNRIAHTRNLNTGSIGHSLCCMYGAKERPFKSGKYPMKREQWDAMIEDGVTLCRHYKIPVTRETVLSHAEVQATLGVKQRGKWDFTRLAFDPSVSGARAIGDRFRAEIARRIGRADPKYAGDLAGSRTMMGAGMAGGGGAGLVADSAMEIQYALESADGQLSAGNVVGLVIGAVILIGAGMAIYARWDDAGRPWPDWLPFGRKAVA